MEHDSSLEADSCQSSQEISSTLRNAKVHHTVQIPHPNSHPRRFLLWARWIQPTL